MLSTVGTTGGGGIWTEFSVGGTSDPARAFVGLIDDAFFRSDVLTDAEVAALVPEPSGGIRVICGLAVCGALILGRRPRSETGRTGRRNKTTIGLLAVGLTALNTGTRAGAAAIDFTSVSGGFADAVPRVIGWEFTTGSRPLSVTQLGVYDHKQDGLITSHDIAIYDFEKHAAVVSGSPASGVSSPLSGVFRYIAVSPVTLSPNTQYLIAASWPQNADEFVWAGGPGLVPADIANLSIDPAITLGLTVSGVSASARFDDMTAFLRFPDKRIADVNPGDTRTVFVGPTFVFETVPEPAGPALGLFAMSVVITTRTGYGYRIRPRLSVRRSFSLPVGSS